MPAYDSKLDTVKHIARVSVLMTFAARKLGARMLEHDRTKLGPDEKPFFDAIGPNIRDIPFPSEEYDRALDALDAGLLHHWRFNPHHPEFHSALIVADGVTRAEVAEDTRLSGAIAKMSLLDLLEMVCDWQAAGERHANGSFGNSLLANRDRFAIGDQLFSVLVATATELGFLPPNWDPAPTPATGS